MTATVTTVPCSMCAQRGMPIICDALHCLDCCACDDHRQIPCLRCEESGQLLVCTDDICHGLGECMNGNGSCDGMRTCPDCQGEGWI
ncbi:MAG: hypothetical protein F4Y02_10590 [Chloroflexi bacterium]|nr:hypothetical protein [Chloroflexota bacterium]